MKAKELQCMSKMIHEGFYEDFKEYIIENKLAPKQDLEALIRDTEKARFICATLEQSCLDDKLQLIDYEWTLLPRETIKITCVSNIEKREFTYGI